MANEPVSRGVEGIAKEVFWTGDQGALTQLKSDPLPTTTPNGSALRDGVRLRFTDSGESFLWSAGRAMWVPEAALNRYQAGVLALFGELIEMSRLQLLEMRALRIGMQAAQDAGDPNQPDWMELALAGEDEEGSLPVPQ